MKRRIIILLFLIYAGLVFAQKFTITPEGYKNAEEPSKDFIVVEKPGKSKQELFINVKKYLSSQYKGMKGDGYNEIENEQIILDIQHPWQFGGYELNRYEINFKDGKIMIKPKFEYIQSSQDRIYLTGGSALAGGSVFNKKGKARTSALYNLAQNSANSFVSGLIENINNTQDW